MTAQKTPKAGDICQCCKTRWEKKKRPLIKLVSLPKVHAKYKTRVAVCPYCDGEAIKVAKAAAARLKNDTKQ